MFEFRLPDLGEGIHEGEILKWHVAAGGQIAEDAPLVDVETDKAAVTIPSPRAGTVVSVGGGVGAVVHTGDVLCVIDEAGTGTGTGTGTGAGTGTGTGTGAGAAVPEAPVDAGSAAMPTTPSAPATAPAPALPERRVPAAPATRRLARELAVDLSGVTPTGPSGRVTDADVRRAAETRSGAADRRIVPARGGTEADGSRPAPAAGDGTPARSEAAEATERPAVFVPGPGAAPLPLLDLEPLPDFAAYGPIRTEPLRSIRRKTARRMVTAATLVPHVAHLDEIDVTALESLRKEAVARRADRPGGHLTLLAFVVKAVAMGLRDHPSFNASVDPFREEIVFKDYVHVGVAVDSGRGLIVPVIRDAGQRSIVAIADAVDDLARRGREGTLAAGDLRGGTFTITNIGFLGGTGLVPLVNYPEVAILGLARAQEKPVVRDGQVVIRTMLPVTLAFDHRVADGADAARFVNDLKRRLENPVDLFLEA